MRYLLVTRRIVPLDRLDEYAAAWAAVVVAAAAHDCRAYLFRRTSHEDRFTEFVEWAGPGQPLEAADLAEALAELDVCGTPQDPDVWEEAELS